MSEEGLNWTANGFVVSHVFIATLPRGFRPRAGCSAQQLVMYSSNEATHRNLPASGSPKARQILTRSKKGRPQGVVLDFDPVAATSCSYTLPSA
jgi:hypothetical protein